MIRAANPSLWVPSRGTLAKTDMAHNAPRDLMKYRVFSKMETAVVLYLSFDLWMNKRHESFGLYATFVDKSSTSWQVVEACLGIFDAPDVNGDQLSNSLEDFLSQADLKAMGPKLRFSPPPPTVAQTSRRWSTPWRIGLIAPASFLTSTSQSSVTAAPLSSQHCQVFCQVQGVRHFDFGGPLAFLLPGTAVPEVTGYFLNGTTALKNSHAYLADFL
jgi:hypothetical protein